MRPPRILFLILFVSATLVLLSRCVSYYSQSATSAGSPGGSATARKSKSSGSVWNFMYYNTPFSLFPPNAAISLTDDNSTSFAARPAAFGPSLAPRGLSGQLWVGSGFAEDAYSIGGELGCSDMPGWASGARPDAVDKILKGTIPQAATIKHDQGSELSGRDEEHSPNDMARHSTQHMPPGSDEIKGKVVLLMRGYCGFLDKVMWAQRRGAIAVVVGDNQRGGPLIQMFAHGPEVDNVTIPSVFTARTTAQLLSTLAQPGSFLEDTVDEQGNPVLRVHRQPQPKTGKVQVRTEASSEDDKSTGVTNGFTRVLKRSGSSSSLRQRVRASKTKRMTSEMDESEEVHDFYATIFDASGNADDGEDDQPRNPDSPDSDIHEGLWVTIIPSSGATPFFDTLLVLVISPLVTLTVVYALLILRARIRRRRWRAPKSVVEQLPVRTYHTVPASTPGATPRVPSPNSSSPTTPLLQESPVRTPAHSRGSTANLESDDLLTPNVPIPTPATSSRHGQRSEREKGSGGFSAEWKKYMGRQFECVVCLEEYVDGVSQVMSLPCGHEFHAECITPWLTTRRRTCPICKGDVVRSLAHASSSEPHYEPYRDDDSDDESPIAEASGSGAAERDTDLEQGLMSPEPRPSRGWTRQENWLGIFTNGFGGISRTRSPEDRSR